MIIGLTGKRLAGKDTVANYLVEKYGYEHVSYGKKMKEAIAALFNITVEEVEDYKDDRSFSVLDRVEVHLEVGGIFTKAFGWVEFLQRFGTEMGRNVLGEDLWLNYCFPDPEQYHHASDLYRDEKLVVKDVRFENEAKRILDLGGKIIEIRREWIDEKNDAHVSEAGLPSHYSEYVIANTDTIESLYKDVDAILHHIEIEYGDD